MTRISVESLVESIEYRVARGLRYILSFSFSSPCYRSSHAQAKLHIHGNTGRRNVAFVRNVILRWMIETRVLKERMQWALLVEERYMKRYNILDIEYGIFKIAGYRVCLLEIFYYDIKNSSSIDSWKWNLGMSFETWYQYVNYFGTYRCIMDDISSPRFNSQKRLSLKRAYLTAVDLNMQYSVHLT